MIPLSFSLAFGDMEDFTTDKSIYYDSDTLYVSGNVFSDLEAPGVTIVILDPNRSTFVTLGSTTANSDGSFSTTLHVGGPTWSTFGIYPIRVTSEGTTLEELIEYRESSTPHPEPIPEHPSTFVTLKFQIPNFPSFDKSPQYYIERYNNEPDYKSWFDSQFSDISIYNILGYEYPVYLPPEMKINAGKWATGAIPDSIFVAEIEFLLENNIVMISDIPSGDVSGDEIPNWIRNNAL